jgi:hypothetical protein
MDELLGNKLALPSFNQETFPFVLGVTKDEKEMYLLNTQTWHS